MSAHILHQMVRWFPGGLASAFSLSAGPSEMLGQTLRVPYRFHALLGLVFFTNVGLDFFVSGCRFFFMACRR